ncbi:hypothetical protein LXA43DRAFT_123492 [Ganoderma leucocontextum]|nr:hypothetical protein LXA43DRAFT_123492 [Ganoderma leucocontextum]
MDFRFKAISLLVGVTATIGIVLAVVNGNPSAHEVCQTGCNAVLVACYGTGGFSLGRAQGVSLGPPPSMLGAICNTAIGSCLAACTAAICQ